MLKGIVNGVEKEITRIPMLVNGTYKEGWEVRDNQDRLIWGYNSTVSGTSPLSFKGGGTALTDYSIVGNLSQASGTTNVPSKSVTVAGIESGTDYAEFALEDFPGAAVGDTITVNVSGTNYSLKVKKVDSTYVYVENRTV